MSGLANLSGPAFRYRGSDVCDECGDPMDGDVTVIETFRDGARWFTHLRCTHLLAEDYVVDEGVRMGGDPQVGAEWVAHGGGAESALHIARAIRESDREAARAKREGLRKLIDVERGRLKKAGARVKALEAELEALR